MEINDKDFAAANRRGARTRERFPRVVEVRYGVRLTRLIVELDSGLGLLLPLEHCQGLHKATPDDLSGAEISPSGLGIHFPKLDIDLYLPALVREWLDGRPSEGRSGDPDFG